MTVETLPSRFFHNVRRLGSRTSHYYNSGGQWFPVGWSTFGDLVSAIASGLIELGHAQGDALAVLSSTRREWIYADLANQCAGGVSVGVYPSLTAEQVSYVVDHAECKFCVVENRDQLHKVLSVEASMPRLQTLIVIDPAGVDLASHPDRVVSLADVIERGRAADHDVAARVANIELEAAQLFVYTSGTTGPPKGAMLTHGNIAAAMRCADIVPVADSDVGFSFLPLAHVAQRVADYRGLWLGVGSGGYFARGLDTIAEDLADAGPTVLVSVPRIFEKIYAAIHDQVSQGSPATQRVFRWACGVGSRVAARRRQGRPVGRLLEAQNRVARRLVFDKLRARLGGRARLFYTGGAPIAKEILQFFEAADINILEGWGMTETFGVGTLNLPGVGNSKIGSIGRPVPGVDIKLDDDGEMLIKGASVFSGYYKQEDVTRQSFTSDGYFRTGDIATVDEDGFYFIIDRKKDLIITAGGKNIGPQHVENLLKSDPRVSQCVLIGDRRAYCVALISVDDELRRSVSEADLVAQLQQIVADKNRALAPYEQIKKFRLLPRDLSQEAGELTPTLKIKRKVIVESYADLIEEMYSEVAVAKSARPRAN